MKLEVWTLKNNPRFQKYMSKALGEAGLRWENITVRDKLSDMQSRPGQIELILGRDLFEKLGPPEETLDHLRGAVWTNQPQSFRIYTYSPCDTSLGDRPQNLFNADLSKMAIWWKDCHKGARVALKGFKPPTEEFIICPSFEKVQQILQMLIRDPVLIAIDLETVGWKDTIRPFLFGIAWNQSEGISVPLLRTRDTSYWTPGQEVIIRELLSKVLCVCPQVYQNVLFDVKVLRQNGFEFPLELVQHDTMLLHHTLDSALPHTLDFITSIYGDTPYWKDTLKQAPQKLIELPLEESSAYNLRDCVVLHQILPPMLEELRENNLEDIYYNETMAGIPSALEQMETAVYLSEDAVCEWQKHVTKKVKDYDRKLRKLWPITKHFKLNSSDHLGWLIGNQPMQKFEDLNNLSDYEESPKQACRCTECNRKFWAEKGQFPGVCTKCGSTTFNHLEEFKLQARKKKLNNKGEISKTYQNLLNLQKLSEIPRFYEGKFKIRVSPKSRKYQTDEKARQKLRFECQKLFDVPSYRNHPDRLKRLRIMAEWLETYDCWAHAEKQRSTYTQFPRWSDGKMHYNILLHGTETGRPASRDVNILNQPTKKEPLLGACYVAPRGWTIVSGDYSNLEARVMAYVVQDPVFIEAVEAGNLHDVNTRALFKIDQNDKLWKSGRAAAKIFQFGRIQYGGGREIYEQIVLAAPELQLSYEDFESLTDNYFDTYEIFGTWREKTARDALQTRKSFTAFGRVRHLYGHEHEIVKQAYNFPGQGTAAGVMNRVQAAALQMRDQCKFSARLQVQIYDDLRWLVRNEEVDDFITHLRPVMEKPFEIFGTFRTFPTDFETGNSWGNLSPYKEK